MKINKRLIHTILVLRVGNEFCKKVERHRITQEIDGSRGNVATTRFAEVATH